MHRPKHPIVMAIFVAFLVMILGGIHYFIYYSMTRFIDISESENGILALMLGILWLSFPIATFLAGQWDNRKTRYLYYLTSVWMGFVHFLTVMFGMVWVIAVVGSWMDIYIPLIFLEFIGFVIAIVLAVYGLYNARIIRKVEIEVPMRNLPDQWDGKKIALISDVHVGHILRAPFIRRIVRKVNKEHVEMLCIAGDLFDGMDGKLEHLLDPLNQITAPHGIFYANGNHETYLGVERAFRALGHTKTRILRDEIVDVDGLDIIGIEYPDVGETIDVAKTILNIPGYDRERPSVLLFHTPLQIERTAKTGINLELCGHTHKGQLWPFGLVTWLMFRQYHYGLSTIDDYNVYTSSGIGTWGPPMRVGSQSELVIIALKKK